MKKKKIVLQCPCNFTRTGLEALIREPALSASLEIVACSKNFEESESLVACLPTVDILFLVLSYQDYSLASFLHLIGDSLPEMHPSCTVVLVGELTYMEALKLYFRELNNALVTLDNATSLTKLQEQLLNIDRNHGETAASGSNFSAILSSRELLVLRRLLDGESSSKIAVDLELSNKTISHYKCAALAKLGIRSLCPLVMKRYSVPYGYPLTMNNKHAMKLR
jgi:DNA-binding NarL/FixJ family response regulator